MGGWLVSSNVNHDAPTQIAFVFGRTIDVNLAFARVGVEVGFAVFVRVFGAGDAAQLTGKTYGDALAFGGFAGSAVNDFDLNHGNLLGVPPRCASSV